MTEDEKLSIDELLTNMYSEQKRLLHDKHGNANTRSRIKSVLKIKKSRNIDEEEFFKSGKARETLFKSAAKNFLGLTREWNILYTMKTLRYVTIYTYVGAFIILMLSGFEFRGFELSDSVLIALIASIAGTKIIQSITDVIKPK